MRPGRRRAAAGLALVLLLGGSGVATSARAVLDPPITVDSGQGPIVVLGGSPLRLEGALGLAGVADGQRALVLAGDVAEAWRVGGGACDDVLVTCIAPEPATTHGEALATAALADARGWERLTVVTSTFHVRRTRWLFASCVDAEVTVVGVDDPAPVSLTAWRVVRETLALGRDIAIHGCG